MTKPKAMTKVWYSKVRRSSRCVLPAKPLTAMLRTSGFPGLGLVVDPVARRSEDQRRAARHHEQQRPGHGRRVAHLKIFERLLIQVQRVQQYAVQRRPGAT